MIEADAPICAICGKPKKKLPERTEQTHEPIWVCFETVRPAKMPCDGKVFVNATRRV